MPSDIAIRVNGLGKKYRIAHETAAYKTLGETVTNAVKAPFRRLTGQAPARTTEDFWALKDVSFEVKRGEVIGIIGRNGAGKSTLLKILSRITTPTEGTVEVHGRIGSLLEVGTGFHPELSGRENIYLSGSILGMKRSEIDAKFDEIVKFAEMEKFLDTPVKRYSSGMYVRLAFAVAAHLEPEILIIDEVLAVGDAAFQKKCLGKMGEVAKRGRTVLFVSHNMNAIENLCGSCILLEKGKIERSGGSVHEIISNYLFGSEQDVASLWVNDGSQFDNPWFKPIKFYATDESGRAITNSIDNNQSVHITIECYVEEIDPSLTVGYAIYDSDGILLYWSYQTDTDEDRWPEIHQGVNILKSNIPPHFLNEGNYVIELTGGLHFRQWLFEPRVSSPLIKINIQGGLSNSPYWMMRRPGILAPIMPWSIENEGK